MFWIWLINHTLPSQGICIPERFHNFICEYSATTTASNRKQTRLRKELRKTFPKDAKCSKIFVRWFLLNTFLSVNKKTYGIQQSYRELALKLSLVRQLYFERIDFHATSGRSRLHLLFRLARLCIKFPECVHQLTVLFRLSWQYFSSRLLLLRKALRGKRTVGTKLSTASGHMVAIYLAKGQRKRILHFRNVTRSVMHSVRVHTIFGVQTVVVHAILCRTGILTRQRQRSAQRLYCRFVESCMAFLAMTLFHWVVLWDVTVRTADCKDWYVPPVALEW